MAHDLDITLVHAVSDFVDGDRSYDNSLSTYCYEGRCPQTGQWVSLPRTAWVEAIARGLMRQLARDDRYSREGKMYGVLLVESIAGECYVLKAFSGLLQGQATIAGWVGAIPGRGQVALEEAHTLAELERIKCEIIKLQENPEQFHYQTLTKTFKSELQHLSTIHSQRKQQRHQHRQQVLNTLSGDRLVQALESLDQQSREDGMARRHLKRRHNQVLQPLKERIEQINAQIHDLKHQRQTLSRQLQAHMHASYWLTNFSGTSLPLQQLMPQGAIPTGTGDCCAPKLLHYAATHHLKPLALAEFWWGLPSPNGDKVAGEFYGACAERCQPLMGFLLSGLSDAMIANVLPDVIPEAIPDRVPDAVRGAVQNSIPTATSPLSPTLDDLAVTILYEDEWLIAVNKPAGLLSVPGRYGDRQDSVLNRLRYQMPDGASLRLVHRLDQDTSGILLVARDLPTYHHLSRQFQQRQVTKVYEAIVAGLVVPSSGVIDLPLWSDPHRRPYQVVDWHRGKPSLTQFYVLARQETDTRMRLLPQTGRTHQLRVHMADAAGLGMPIVGDRLYGHTATMTRLHLHAKELTIHHPHKQQSLCLQADVPF